MLEDAKAALESERSQLLKGRDELNAALRVAQHKAREAEDEQIRAEEEAAELRHEVQSLLAQRSGSLAPMGSPPQLGHRLTLMHTPHAHENGNAPYLASPGSSGMHADSAMAAEMDSLRAASRQHKQQLTQVGPCQPLDNRVVVGQCCIAVMHTTTAAANGCIYTAGDGAVGGGAQPRSVPAHQLARLAGRGGAAAAADGGAA